MKRSVAFIVVIFLYSQRTSKISNDYQKLEDSIFSIDTFNAFVHNKDFYPEAEQLKKNWDNLEIFFVKLWELI